MHLQLKNSELLAIIDDEDFKKVEGYKWRVQRQKRDAYENTYVVATIYKGSSKEYGTARQVYMHRLITDCPAGMVVDHINGNQLDNRKQNLRICTTSENQKNRHHNPWLKKV